VIKPDRENVGNVWLSLAASGGNGRPLVDLRSEKESVMIELAFIVCLEGQPNHCEERGLLFADITPMTCMMGAQPQLAQWSAQNPEWHVRGWKCKDVTVREARI
jgi:hypothetical protein